MTFCSFVISCFLIVLFQFHGIYKSIHRNIMEIFFAEKKIVITVKWLVRDSLQLREQNCSKFMFISSLDFFVSVDLNFFCPSQLM